MESRLLFIELLASDSREQLHGLLQQTKLMRLLGTKMFELPNWHQSLCAHRFPDTPEMLASLLEVGDSIRADAFTLSFDRLQSQGSAPHIHWAYRCSGDVPPGFLALTQSIRNAVVNHGVVIEQQVSPHITISYDAPEKIKSVRIPAVHWPVQSFALVRAAGSENRYTALRRWALQGDAQLPSAQLGLW